MVHDDDTVNFEETRTEKALDRGAIAASFAPWIGGPIGGQRTTRRLRSHETAASIPSPTDRPY